MIIKGLPYAADLLFSVFLPIYIDKHRLMKYNSIVILRL